MANNSEVKIPSPDNHADKDYLIDGADDQGDFADTESLKIAQGKLNAEFNNGLNKIQGEDKINQLQNLLKSIEKKLGKAARQSDDPKEKDFITNEITTLGIQKYLVEHKLAEVQNIETETIQSEDVLRAEVEAGAKKSGTEVKAEKVELVKEVVASELVAKPEAKKEIPKNETETEVQNKKAAEIAETGKDIYKVKAGDTLGAIVKGLTDTIDWGMAVDYRSEKLSADQKPKTLSEANQIWPDQFVWIENGKIIVADKESQSSPDDISKTEDLKIKGDQNTINSDQASEVVEPGEVDSAKKDAPIGKVGKLKGDKNIVVSAQDPKAGESGSVEYIEEDIVENEVGDLKGDENVIKSGEIISAEENVDQDKEKKDLESSPSISAEQVEQNEIMAEHNGLVREVNGLTAEIGRLLEEKGKTAEELDLEDKLDQVVLLLPRDENPDQVLSKLKIRKEELENTKQKLEDMSGKSFIERMKETFFPKKSEVENKSNTIEIDRLGDSATVKPAAEMSEVSESSTDISPELEKKKLSDSAIDQIMSANTGEADADLINTEAEQTASVPQSAVETQENNESNTSGLTGMPTIPEGVAAPEFSREQIIKNSQGLEDLPDENQIALLDRLEELHNEFGIQDIKVEFKDNGFFVFYKDKKGSDNLIKSTDKFEDVMKDLDDFADRNKVEKAKQSAE